MLCNAHHQNADVVICKAILVENLLLSGQQVPLLFPAEAACKAYSACTPGNLPSATPQNSCQHTHSWQRSTYNCHRSCPLIPHWRASCARQLCVCHSAVAVHQNLQLQIPLLVNRNRSQAGRVLGALVPAVCSSMVLPKRACCRQCILLHTCESKQVLICMCSVAFTTATHNGKIISKMPLHSWILL